MAEAGASRAPGIDFALRESAAGHARLEAACKTVLEVRRTGPAAACDASALPLCARARGRHRRRRRPRLAAAPTPPAPQCLGEDVCREGIQKTPARMARALLAMTAGYAASPAALVADALFECDSREMVLVRDIEVNSMCEHHMLPFFGRAHVAYLPAGRVVGISKLARIVDCFGKRLQIQERLTQQVALGVQETTAARGVAVIVECTCVRVARRRCRAPMPHRRRSRRPPAKRRAPVPPSLPPYLPPSLPPAAAAATCA